MTAMVPSIIQPSQRSYPITKSCVCSIWPLTTMALQYRMTLSWYLSWPMARACTSRSTSNSIPLLERLDNNQSYLTQDSFCRLTKHLHDFVTGKTPRPARSPSRPVSPLDRISVPTLSAETMACVAWGKQLELARQQAYLTCHDQLPARWHQRPQPAYFSSGNWRSQAVPVAC